MWVLEPICLPGSTLSLPGCHVRALKGHQPQVPTGGLVPSCPHAPAAPLSCSLSTVLQAWTGRIHGQMGQGWPCTAMP